MDTAIAFLIAAAVTALFTGRYHRSARNRERRARRAAAEGGAVRAPRSQHPHVDVSACIGCGGCTDACPEGEVLGLLGGKAAIVDGTHCIGHSLCAEACPVGAITMVMAPPSMAADLPVLTPEHESSQPNVFVAGELGGLALIRSAVTQGVQCIDAIARRLEAGRCPVDPDVHDVVIVGAGPAGISASLRAMERKLRYVTLEREEIGGTVAKFPRQKLVMTSPVELPLYGRFTKTEIGKEELLQLWQTIITRTGVRVRTGEAVADVRRQEGGVIQVVTAIGSYRARAVVLALGRAGTPRRLGVPGEELPKVMYRLVDAGQYRGKRVLVVGGGDSAVEAALGLAHQRGNRVTLSYRQDRFGRIKARNAERLEGAVRSAKVRVLLSSRPVAFTPDAAVLDVGGTREEVPNDFVWIFAGGVPPNDFLKKVGIAMGSCDLTAEASRAVPRADQRTAPLGAPSIRTTSF